MPITPLPNPPSRSDPSNFSERADAFMAALPAFATETNATAVDVDADAVSAAASAVNAAASAAGANASANVSKWVSGTTYAQGDVEWSPINFFSYRRKVAGAGTTDPSADPTNWALVSGAGDVSLTGVQTLSNKTLTSPIINTPIINTPIINTPTINTPTINSINGGQLAGMRNRIINGKMDIAQRGTSFPGLNNPTYTLDRFYWATTTSAIVTVSQQADAPSNNEFQSSLRVTITTADTSISASDLVFAAQVIEGYNVQDLIGRTFTLSFWVRSSKVGIHCIGLRNSGAGRSYVAEYTINSANTWEQKSITVSGGLITAGTWNWTSGVGLVVHWALAAGTTVQTTAGAWQTGNFLATANQVNCLDTIGNIFAITGVQLEVGPVATPFEHRPYGMELALCQRYYEKTQATIGASSIYSAAAAWLSWKVTKRANPTVTTIPDAGSGGLYTAFGPDGAYQSSTNSVGAGATITASSEL